MIQVQIRSQLESLERLTSQLSRSAVASATANAINRSIIHGRVNIKKEIKKEYNIKSSDLKDITVRRASSSKLTGLINASGRPISITNFNPVAISGANRISVRRSSKGVTKTIRSRRSAGQSGVSFEVLKGKKVNIPYAFIINNNTHLPVFARGYYSGSGDSYSFVKRDKRVVKSGSDLPITKLLTTSIYGAVQNNNVSKNINTDVSDYFSTRLQHELRRKISRL